MLLCAVVMCDQRTRHAIYSNEFADSFLMFMISLLFLMLFRLLFISLVGPVTRRAWCWWCVHNVHIPWIQHSVQSQFLYKIQKYNIIFSLWVGCVWLFCVWMNFFPGSVFSSVFGMSLFPFHHSHLLGWHQSFVRNILLSVHQFNDSLIP